jgi:hypothetical protein
LEQRAFPCRPLKALAGLCPALLIGCAHANAPAAPDERTTRAAEELGNFAGEWDCEETMVNLRVEPGGATSPTQVTRVTLSIKRVINAAWVEVDWIGRDPDFPIMRGMAGGERLHLFDRGGRYGEMQAQRVDAGSIEYRMGGKDGGTLRFARFQDGTVRVAWSAGTTQVCRRTSS